MESEEIDEVLFGLGVGRGVGGRTPGSPKFLVMDDVGVHSGGGYGLNTDPGIDTEAILVGEVVRDILLIDIARDLHSLGEILQVSGVIDIPIDLDSVVLLLGHCISVDFRFDLILVGVGDDVGLILEEPLGDLHQGLGREVFLTIRLTVRTAIVFTF